MMLHSRIVYADLFNELYAEIDQKHGSDCLLLE